MLCNSCASEIEQERLEVLPETKICVVCAHKINPPRNKGIIYFENKTGGVMQTISPESFEEWQYYNPYGRDTGMGSGVHRVMESSEV